MRKAILAGILTLTVGIFASLQTDTQAATLSEARKGAISQNCSSIRASLQNLQKVDSRTRVFLGSVYRNVLDNFMTPLNLRLVKDNKAVSELVAVQTEFAEGKDDFSEKFVVYAQGLEELIAMDCVREPEKFYEKLVEVREKRAAVRKMVGEMDENLTEHRKIVKKVKEGLE